MQTTDTHNASMRALWRGPVKKLVMLNQSWKDRRWNNRWLELHGNCTLTLRYYLEDGGKEPINTISAHQIFDIVDVRHELRSRQDCSSVSALPSILDIISNDSEDLDFSVLITTRSDGLDRGREYLFRMASAADLQSFVPALQGVVESFHRESTELTSLIWRLRSRLRTIYEGNIFQLFVAVMIFANFGSNVAQTQLNPQDGSPPASVLYAIDLTLTILFTAELIINFMSSDIRPFLRDGLDARPSRENNVILQ
jgi:hypothetical protein